VLAGGDTPSPHAADISGPIIFVPGTALPPTLTFEPPAGPVLLVPGYGGNRRALLQLAARIERTGRQAIVIQLPGDGTGDLAQQARVLQAAVERALRGGAPSVDVVGYSAGGVVVRLWLTDDGGDGEARRVVTLGAPLHGAEIAAVGAALAPGACPLACQQLVPGSSLLNRLNAQPLPVGIGWMSIWTTDDKTVDPPDSARLTGAVNVAVQDICPHEVVSHSGLPTDPVVTGLVLAAIGDGPLTAPSPADCTHLRSSGR
jgi:triacylglycerol lipase